MENIIKTSLLGLLFGTFGTTLGGLIGITFKNPSNKLLSFILSLASGLMIAVVCFELVPEASNISNMETIIIGIIMGIAMMIFCDCIIKKKFKSKSAGSNTLLKTGIVVSIGLAIHNIPEGLAIGTGFEASIKLGYSLAIAIAIHDIPEGMFQSRLYENNLKFA